MIIGPQQMRRRSVVMVGAVAEMVQTEAFRDPGPAAGPGDKVIADPEAGDEETSELRRFVDAAVVVVPAHNEEACVGDVVRRLKAVGFSRIRVVDNASSDRTGEVAAAAGAEVIFRPERGYGLACWAGGLDLPRGVEWIVYCNADASDDFAAYSEMARLAPDYDLILGARTHLDDRLTMTMPQRFGNWLAPFLVRRIWGKSYADLGPQRAIRVDAYRRLRLRDRGFGWTVEMQVRAVEDRLRVIEIPVRTYARPAGVSKISGNLRGSLAAGTIILSTIWNLAKSRRQRAMDAERAGEL